MCVKFLSGWPVTVPDDVTSNELQLRISSIHACSTSAFSFSSVFKFLHCTTKFAYSFSKTTYLLLGSIRLISALATLILVINIVL